MRPRFHFSQAVGWNNDVNGTVYHDGEWHLFFQHNPAGLSWDNISWGHAVSSDLVHWRQLDTALQAYTMGRGMCWSGSANIDARNTAGFKSGTEDPMVAFFTDQQGGESLAYSTDRGRTFTMYEDNPVLRHNGRDPKVIWYAYERDDTPLNDDARKLGGHWVMAVYEFEGQGNTAYVGANEKNRGIAFYTSTDLKQWQAQSRLEGYYECAELFELPVAPAAPGGKAHETRWVVYAGDARYGIGRFDGRTFTPEHPDRHTLYYGPFYGSQIFSNAPDGRVVQLGWLNIDIHHHPFNQLFSLPYEVTLRPTKEGARLFAEPVRELESLRGKSHTAPARTLDDSRAAVIATDGDLFDITAEFQVGSAGQVGIEIGNESVLYHVKEAQLGGSPDDAGDQERTKSAAPLEPVDGVVSIRVLVDRASLEIIGNHGRVVIVRGRPHRHEHRVPAIKAVAKGGHATLRAFHVHELESIRQNE